MKPMPSLENLIHQLARFPGIGYKTAARLAYHLIQSKNSFCDDLKKSLEQAQDKISLCQVCFCFKEDKCPFCFDDSRKKDLLCILENPQDIFQIESSNIFKGSYHILHGLISPLKGMSAEDLNIQALLKRIKESKVKEVIFAFDASLEGDTTALYLKDELKKFKVKISRIAHGIPMGGNIDYLDHRTLSKALENRIEL